MTAQEFDAIVNEAVDITEASDEEINTVSQELLKTYIVLDPKARCFQLRDLMIEKWKALNMISSFAISGN